VALLDKFPILGTWWGAAGRNAPPLRPRSQSRFRVESRQHPHDLRDWRIRRHAIRGHRAHRCTDASTADAGSRRCLCATCSIAPARSPQGLQQLTKLESFTAIAGRKPRFGVMPATGGEPTRIFDFAVPDGGSLLQFTADGSALELRGQPGRSGAVCGVSRSTAVRRSS
jgi:hypothetical protein